jgi:hypothetical protein
MNFGALAGGQDIKMPPMQSSGFGNFGTVICTELYRQGYYPDHIYQADVTYGMNIRMNRPEVYWGYRFLAEPIVRRMKRSEAFTALIAFFAVPWARNMAGEKNLTGALVSLIGEPICAFVGRIKLKIEAGAIEYGN